MTKMNFGFSLHERASRKPFLLFVVLSWVCILFVFRGAVSGERILAPLDIPATIFPKFKYINPSSGKIPRNHYLIDMFDLVLPRQYLAYEAIQAGEFPWWDPYTDGGRPLAVEGHANLTDPLRLVLCRFLPFVAAYNWTHILHSFLTGLSMFLLVRLLGFSQYVTLVGALSFQFSGLQALMFYPEFVPNTLWHYPLLWIVLVKYFRASWPLAVGLGGILCAGAILAGSQQSHAWLVLFMACLALGYGLASSKWRQDLVRLSCVAAGAFLLGSAIAAPVLVPQIEIFLRSYRDLGGLRIGKHLLTGVFSLTGVFPWLAGSFRTLDLGKIIDQAGPGYLIFVGTPIMILAIVAVCVARRERLLRRPEVLTAVFLLVAYLVLICSTPLLNTLYIRSAGLAVVGLVVLFGAGLQEVVADERRSTRNLIKVAVTVLAFVVAVAHLFAFLVYPRLEG